MQWECYDTLHVKMDNALVDEIKMVYKRIHTHITPVSQSMKRTNTPVENTVEMFAKRFLVESPSKLTGKRSQIGMRPLCMTLMCACVIVERLD